MLYYVLDDHILLSRREVISSLSKWHGCNSIYYDTWQLYKHVIQACKEAI